MLLAVQFCVDDVKDEPCTSTAVTLCDNLTAKRGAAVRSKPPNILIYCGKKDSSRLFARVKSVLCQCISSSQYAVYHLKHEDVMSTVWQDNTSLLVVASDKVYDGVDRLFLQYFVRGGTLLSFGSAFDNLIVERRVRLPAMSGQFGVVTLQCHGLSSVSVIGTKYCYAEPVLSDVTMTCLASDDASSLPVIVEAVHQSSTGVAILSQVCLRLSVCLSVS